MNSPIKVKVENDDSSGCLFVIFIVMLIVLYQLVAIKQVLLKEYREQHEPITQEEVTE